jgi:divalent metal cation (Fe/Co/Zn/Cd) transporter
MADKQSQSGQAAAGRRRETWVHIGLAVIKGAGGSLFGSSVLLADAFRSASDAIVAYAAGDNGKRKEFRTAESEGPTGKVYTFAYISSILLIVIGLQMAVLAVNSMTNPLDAYPKLQAAFVIPICLGLRLLFVRGPIPRREWAVSLTAAAGAACAWAGGESGQIWMTYLDPAASALVGAYIVYQGYLLFLGTGKNWEVPQAEPSGLAEDLTEIIQRVDGVVTVEAVHPVMSSGRISAEIVISVNPRISVLEGSDIGRRVKQLVLKRFMHIHDVKICVEPYNPGYPYKSNHDPNQEHMPTLLQ